jgi:hypothetical protein
MLGLLSKNTTFDCYEGVYKNHNYRFSEVSPVFAWNSWHHHYPLGVTNSLSQLFHFVSP